MVVKMNSQEKLRESTAAVPGLYYELMENPYGVWPIGTIMYAEDANNLRRLDQIGHLVLPQDGVVVRELTSGESFTVTI